MTVFRVLKWCSFAHSAVYAALLTAALTGGDTTVLGWVHGVGWIVMSVACLAAVPRRVLPLKVAVAVVVLGGVGPFVGSAAFILEERARTRAGHPRPSG